MFNILPLNGKTPDIADGVFIAPNAQIIGDVVIEAGASIWFGAVIRGDFGPIRIGKNTSIQDNCVIHVSKNGTYIGDNNTIGHGAVIHESTLKDNIVVGMNTVILDGTEIESECVIGAGSTVATFTKVPPRQLLAGSPAKIKKELSGESLWWVQNSANEYKQLLKKYPKEYFYTNKSI